MARRQYINNASTVQTVGALTNVATSVTVTSAASFPASFPWTAVIDGGTATAEVVLVTAAAGAVLTVTRGFDGTAAQAHANAANFAHVAVKADYDEANLHVNSNNNVHGVTGNVVGTSDTQTLTNKTLTAPVVSSIVNTGTLTLPTSTDTLVGRATTDTLTNKTLTSPAINGGVLDAASTIGGLSGTALGLLPKGWVGGASTTATTSVTTETLINGLSDVSFTAVTGRRYKLTVTLNRVLVAGAGDSAIWRVRDGGASAPTTTSTLLLRVDGPSSATNVTDPQGPVCFHLELTGLSAGTHRIGVSAGRAGSAQPVSVNQGGPSTGITSSVTIEDIGT